MTQRLSVFLLVMALGIFANVLLVLPACAQQPAPPPPSKEYIYLGGRLIATEENGGQGIVPPPDLTPTITSLSRTSAVPGENFQLTVSGTNLAPGGQGSGQLIFTPATGITVTIPTTPADSNTQIVRNVILSNTVAQGPYLVSVKTSKGTGDAPSPFTIGAPSAPVTISFDPAGHSSFPASSSNPPVQVIIDGSGGFLTSGSTVWINGSLYAMQGTPGFSFNQSTNQISFNILPANTTNPQTLGITVHTPISGAAENISNTLSFLVTIPYGPDNPWPILQSFSPNSVQAGAAPPNLIVSATQCSFGTPALGVNQNTVILVNGVARSTSIAPNPPCSVQTQLLPQDVAQPGTLRISVFNPAPSACGIDGMTLLKVCGFALNTFSLQVTPVITTTGHFSIQMNGTAWIKVARNGSSQFNIPGHGPFTVEAWVLPSRLNVSQAIVEKFDTANPTISGGYALRLNRGGNVSFSTYQNSSDFDTFVSQGTVPLDSQWHHVAGVFDGSQLNVYIDGLAQAPGIGSHCSSFGCRAPGNNQLVNLLIGGSPDPTVALFFGNLDEIRVSSSAVYTANFNPQVPAIEDLPAGSGVALWKFDDQSFNDSSSVGDHNNGVAKGGSIFFSGNTPLINTGSTSQDMGGGGSAGVSSLSRESAAPGDGQFNLTAYGTGFSGTGGITITQAIDANGQPAAGITVQTPTNPTCDPTTGNCQASATVTVGPLTAAGSYMVSVGNSDSFIFTVAHPANPVPSLGFAMLTPSSAQVGNPAPTVTISGGVNFVKPATGGVNGSVVRVNGSDRPTHVQDSTLLTFDLQPSDVESAGPLSIAVYNPPLGRDPFDGGTAGGLTFTVTAQNQNPIPTLNSVCLVPQGGGSCLNPVQNGTAGTLKVFGSFFIGPNGSQIVYHGQPLTTQFVSSTELDATLASADTANLTNQTLNVPVFVNTPTPGGGESSMVPLAISGPNPIPTITNLTVNGAAPNIIAGGLQPITLQVIGTGFVGTAAQSTSVVKVNGAGRTTTWVSAAQVTITIAPADIGAPGQLEISVFNPTPGGGTSDPMLLTIQPAGNPVPTLNTLSPLSIQVDSSGLQNPVTLTGSNFMSSSEVLVNGFPRTVISRSLPTQLTVQLADSDLAVLGQLQIKVSNPEPGGGPSAAKSLAVFAPPPRLDSITPISTTAGPNPLTITLNGINFIDESSVLVNGHSVPSGVVPGSGGNQLNATLTDDVAGGGVLSIVVSNPTTPPGGGTSGAQTLLVTNPPPVLSLVSPASTTVGQPINSVTLTGSGFTPGANGSVVQVNGSPRTTTWLSPTSLSVAIAGNDVATAQALQITVVNPTVQSQGGGTSAAQPLLVINPAPGLSTVSPTSVLTNDVDLTALTLTGSGFTQGPNGSVGVVNGSPRVTTWLSGTSLSVPITAADKSLGQVLPITVMNPSVQGQGGGTSGPVNFTVNNPMPTVAGLSRTFANTGGAGFPLTVQGTDFVGAHSTVFFNGNSHTPSASSDSGHLYIQITAADLNTPPGTYAVTVSNPIPGGGTTSVASCAPSGQPDTLPPPCINVTNPSATPPVVSSITPGVVIIGTRNPTPVLTINGSNFVAGSAIEINGAIHGLYTTGVINTTTQIFVQLTLDDMNAPPGAYPVTVVNPDGGISNSDVTFTLANPPQQGGNLVPSSATTLMSPLPELTIMATGFVITADPNTSTTAQINGGVIHQAVAGSDSTHLIIQLLPADVATHGSFTVTWTNPGGGAPTAVTPNFMVFDAPQVNSISPNSATIGQTPPSVTVTGLNFLPIAQTPGTMVNLIGANHNFNPTDFTNNTNTQLVVPLTSDDLNATAGVYPVTVVTTTPGGISNNTVSFTLNNPPVHMSSLSQSSVPTGSGPQTITVTGTGFVRATTVTINGQNRASYVSPTQLNVSILASETATAGAIPITAVNQAPGGGSGTLNLVVSNPVPTISSLAPTAATAGGPSFTLTVNGANFVSGATVLFSGSSRTTTFVSATQLTAGIPASDIASAGVNSITVMNPAPSSGTSVAANFTVNNPVPAISGLSPASATAGGAAFTLTVNGTNFVATSVVRVNGSNRTTTFVSATQLAASIPAGDIAAAGTLSIAVVNPAPGGGASAAASLTVNNPVPTISGLSPASAMAGGAAFTLTVNGTNFVGTSGVQVNGSNRTTTFVSATQLAASIPAGDIASTGTLSITVVNPAPGGGASAAASFAVNVPTPDFSVSLSSSNLSIARGASGTTTITITSLNGFNSATSLSVFGLPSGVTASLSSTSVTPPPGGIATSKVTITVPRTATTGTFTLTIMGASGNNSHSATVTLTIT